MEGEIIAGIAIVLILGGAIGYIAKAKKSGAKCIGCPGGCSCGKRCGQNACGCHGCGREGEALEAVEKSDDEQNV